MTDRHGELLHERRIFYHDDLDKSESHGKDNGYICPVSILNPMKAIITPPTIRNTSSEIPKKLSID